MKCISTFLTVTFQFLNGLNMHTAVHCITDKCIFKGLCIVTQYSYKCILIKIIICPEMSTYGHIYMK